jgi:hypothetical protein
MDNALAMAVTSALARAEDAIALPAVVTSGMGFDLEIRWQEIPMSANQASEADIERLLRSSIERHRNDDLTLSAAIAKEVSALPRVTMAKTGNQKQRRGMPVLPNACHGNVACYIAHGFGEQPERSLGWIERESSFVLHSAIIENDRHICITPDDPDIGATTDTFIPDDKLSSSVEDPNRIYRDGQLVPMTVTTHPNEWATAMQEAEHNLNSGMLPSEAMRRANAALANLR